MLQYRGYKAKVDVNQETGKLCGKVLDIADEIPFEGETFKAVEQEFHKSIDAYLEFCSKLGKEPAKPFPGKYLFRTTPETHRAIYLAATLKEQSVNAWTESVLIEAAREELNPKAKQEPKTKQELVSQADRPYSLRRLAEESTKFAELINMINPYLKNKDLESATLLIQDLEKLWRNVEDIQLALNIEEPKEMSKFLTAVWTFFKSLAEDNVDAAQEQTKSVDKGGIETVSDVSASVFI
ncbi:MAG: type II toxin-antitoxin system HicB family antitoxin [Oscillatoriophycideae cyanobacterium NC_groundwater_1537_Pr4_S-0.65um_50_18]|nr:type II toxin-antitoxin system HicB family antitoxin [Oscillatoriophycideae cyanobacterium NC_groundwater_1537_Pr4_S-0.65um_50_18]